MCIYRFADNLSWKTLAAQGYKAPIVPKIKDEYDVSNFPANSKTKETTTIENVLGVVESHPTDWDAGF